MLNDATWRKMPIDILTNENMRFVENQMPDGFEYAPYMFYIAALRKADDDGIFDLEDGVIFAQLMHVPNEKIVFFVANLMGKRRIIARVSAESNKCLLTDWDYPKGSQPRSWSERRAIVQKMIKEEKINPVIDADFINPNEEDYSFDSFEDDKNENFVSQTVFGDKISKNVTQNVFGDKISKNVTQNVFGDKISKNVAKKNDIEREREREKEREDKNREIRETHTQRDRESVREEERTDVGASAESLDNSASAPTEKKQALARKNKKTENQESMKETQNDNSVQNNFSSDSKPESQIKEKAIDNQSDLFVLLDSFFVGNSFGYDSSKGKNSVLQIVERIKALETERMPADKIAALVVSEFKKMHESDGVWKDIPLTPTMLLNAKVWSYILGVVGKKVAKKIRTDSYLEQTKKYEQEALAEKAGLVEIVNQEYLDYGINPNDPNRFMLLMRAKKLKEPVEQTEDIF